MKRSLIRWCNRSSSLPLFDAVFLINLKRRSDRLQYSLQQLRHANFRVPSLTQCEPPPSSAATTASSRTDVLSSIHNHSPPPYYGTVQVYEAVDGSTVDLDRLAEVGLLSALGRLRLSVPEAQRVWGMDLTVGAVGCALSHIELWSLIAVQQQQWEKVLVLEDDSLIPPSFGKDFQARWQEVPKDWELVYVSGLDTEGRAPRLQVAPGVSRVPRFHRTTNAYVVSPRGAAQLLQQCVPFTYQIDTEMTLQCDVVEGPSTASPNHSSYSSSASLSPTTTTTTTTTRFQPHAGEVFVKSPCCYTLQPSLIVQATRFGSDIQSGSEGGSGKEEEERSRMKAAGWDVDSL